jgi:CMP-N,N'-diacetyllegionaminic acid synthase
MVTSCLIIVPARGGSKRLPGKNLKRLGDRSLLAHTAAAIRRSGLEAPVLLSTDEEGIAAEGERLGWLVPFRRPAQLADDQAGTVDVALHALDWYREKYGSDPEATMVLQPTSPFRGGACLRAAVSLLAERIDIDSVIAMSRLDLPASRLYVATRDGWAQAIADDTRVPLYRPNGALYLARTAAIRRQRTLYAGAIFPLVLDGARAIDIDTADDWVLAEAALAGGLPEEPESFLPRLGTDIVLT